jgi:hypothetical protein
MTQSIKSVPKAIRNNTSVFCIFRFASAKLIANDLWEEVSNTISLENFEKLFEFATQGNNNALVIDFTQNKGNRFKQNWDNLLTIKT